MREWMYSWMGINKYSSIRFTFDKKLSELSDSNDDHPLIDPTNFSFSTLSVSGV